MIEQKDEKKLSEELESFLMVSMDENNEITTELVDDSKVEPTQKLEIEPQVHVQSRMNKECLPTSNLVFHKQYLQLVLILSGMVSGFILAYDLQHQQTIEPRGIVAGFNLFASVVGLSFFARTNQKKEKVDDDPKPMPKQ